jgi:hypothetical protein
MKGVHNVAKRELRFLIEASSVVIGSGKFARRFLRRSRTCLRPYLELCSSHAKADRGTDRVCRRRPDGSPENAADVKALNELLSRGLACSLVLLFHSVPSWVAGDWLVDEDGSTTNWYFSRSRFVAGIDSHFDYKAERHKRLAKIQAKRRRRIAF